MPPTRTYREYMDLIFDSSALKMKEESVAIIERYRNQEYNMSSYDIAIFLVNYTTRQYLYISDSSFNIFGITAKEFIERNLDGFLNTWHPADFEIINTIIFPYNLKFLENIPPDRYGDFIFSYNYRVRNSNDKYINLLQRFSYIPSNSPGMPWGAVGIAFDITHFKNDMSVVQTIEEISLQNGELVNNLVFKKIHPVYEYDISQFLSRRELEVIHYISKGLNSKQIADKMRISINTVNNHRKSMLAKLQCRTSSELTNYAVKHGLV